MPTFVPSQQQIAAALPHVRYVIGQVLNLSNPIKFLAQDQHILNERLDALTIYVRAFYQFLIGDAAKRTQDDILAEDYGVSRFDSLKTTLGIFMDRCNKQTAHLTYTRAGLSPQDARWEFAPVLKELFKAAKQFVQHVLTNWNYAGMDDERSEWSALGRQIDERLTIPRFPIGSTASISSTTVSVLPMPPPVLPK